MTNIFCANFKKLCGLCNILLIPFAFAVVGGVLLFVPLVCECGPHLVRPCPKMSVSARRFSHFFACFFLGHGFP